MKDLHKRIIEYMQNKFTYIEEHYNDIDVSSIYDEIKEFLHDNLVLTGDRITNETTLVKKWLGYENSCIWINKKNNNKCLKYVSKDVYFCNKHNKNKTKDKFLNEILLQYQTLNMNQKNTSTHIIDDIKLEYTTTNKDTSDTIKEETTINKIETLVSGLIDETNEYIKREHIDLVDEIYITNDNSEDISDEEDETSNDSKEDEEMDMKLDEDEIYENIDKDIIFQLDIESIYDNNDDDLLI